MKIPARLFAAVIVCAPLGGLAGEEEAPARKAEPSLEEQVRTFAEVVKLEWPLEDPASREFYRLFSALKKHYEEKNPGIFEMPRWPLLLQERVERELKLRSVRRAARGPEGTQAYSLGELRSPFRTPSLSSGGEVDATVDLQSSYVRKDGRWVRVRGAGESARGSGDK